MSKKNFIFLIKIFFLLLIFLIFNFRKTEEVEAGSGDNVYGWAWSENIGLISFNRINCDANNDGLSDGTPAGCPAAGTSIPNYGVHICKSDTDPFCNAIVVPKAGKFSGYAWSENIGWIRFNPPPDFNTGLYPNCPAATCPGGSPNYPARLNLTTRKITGWARACAGTVNGDCNSVTRTDGWDGWILLGPVVKGSTDYGAWIDNGVSPAEFRSWAWGSDVVGWISFNCRNQGCGSSNYKVMTNLVLPPTVSNLQDSFIDPCTQSRIPKLSWDTDAGTPYDYEIQICSNADCTAGGDPLISNLISNTNSTSWAPACSYCCNVAPYNGITFGSNLYYWRVRTRNTAGAWSDWAGNDFTTFDHCYPFPDFNPVPQSPSANEVIKFTDQTTFYDANPLARQWNWDFNNDSVIDSIIQDPTYSYLITGNYTVSLTVFDGKGYGPCSLSKPLNVTFLLPEWKEIAPF